ncbi:MULTISPECIES: cell wall-binding repeat-containing protein [Paenibacillus]|uniref:cell wall-binding repeat-containing protein n=1 Tax=Paenibacillus TaxID=44249 RepID=UPI00095432B1|nr:MULTISPECIES: cell wall-binding repeat-containing protein [Paenibacillus]MEC0246332.1 cell wall-binding repeat-containing protein [Paenibacillus chitinolyticus]QID16036.1 cell wall-binding repeat-containing protein [Paenibacillus sp. RUD330]SIR68865.1 Putative cell wall binding repeat 2 [Paenibacillus sp. RU4X]SIR76281.1 Putative cell wall binding repeat 2 [Paenibacillus sp. RU4T]
MKKGLKVGIISAATALALTGCFNKSNSSTPHDMNNMGQQTGSEQSPTSAVSMPWIASKNTTRINTSDPAEAAVLVSKTLWMATSDANRPGGIILANPKDWQTTLVSADLIHHPNNGPVLFVNKDNVPDVTLNELKRLKPIGTETNKGTQVILVGDLDPKVEEQVKALGYKTDKIAGGNPAAVAKAVDAYYTAVAKENPPSVIIGSMDSEEYTMPAVNWIAHMPEPLLYVKKDEVPQETVDALKTRGGKANIYLLGPESIISAKVQEQLGQFGKVVRIAGNDPYANAVAFAKYKDSATGFGWGITTPGHNFSFVNKDSAALALAAAPFSHLGKHAPLLWTDKDKLPDTVMTYVMSVQPKYKKEPTEGPYNHAWLTGSEDSLTAAAQGEIDSMLEIVSETGEGHGGHGGGNTKTEPSPKPSEGTTEGGNMSNMPGMKH